MRPQAKPRVNFFAQVSIDTDERRRRLQQRTGYSVPRLVDEALRELETNLDGDLDHPAPELALSKNARAAALPGCATTASAARPSPATRPCPVTYMTRPPKKSRPRLSHHSTTRFPTSTKS
jgi:hypothetical protein